MQPEDLTLKERAGRMYRQLLILQQVFRNAPDTPDSDDTAERVALRAAVKEILDEIGEHARILMSTPFPISEWRSGDGPDDERWRALTEIERRELIALFSEYENLIGWSETAVVESRDQATAGSQNPGFGSAAARPDAGGRRSAAEYLEARRAQLARFRKELTFLDRRRNKHIA